MPHDPTLPAEAHEALKHRRRQRRQRLCWMTGSVIEDRAQGEVALADDQVEAENYARGMLTGRGQ